MLTANLFPTPSATLAFHELQQAIKSLASKEAADSVTALQDLILRLLRESEKENNTIQQMLVPSFDEAPVVAGASLVKAMKPTGLDIEEPLFIGMALNIRSVLITQKVQKQY